MELRGNLPEIPPRISASSSFWLAAIAGSLAIAECRSVHPASGQLIWPGLAPGAMGEGPGNAVQRPRPLQFSILYCGGKIWLLSALERRGKTCEGGGYSWLMKCCSLHCNRDEASSPPVKLEIIDVEKVKGLSNYYVSLLSCRTDTTELPLPLSNHPHISLQAYIIKVLCKDGRIYHIYRRYSQFDDMHSSLEKRFPIESGAIRAKDRVLPSLPGIIQYSGCTLRHHRVHLFGM